MESVLGATTEHELRSWLKTSQYTSITKLAIQNALMLRTGIKYRKFAWFRYERIYIAPSCTMQQNGLLVATLEFLTYKLHSFICNSKIIESSFPDSVRIKYLCIFFINVISYYSTLIAIFINR